jgi:hypothetical protein
MSRLLEPKFQARFHAAMTVFWLLLTIPALIWWKESILYVILLSQWANLASHWSGFQAAHAEKRVKENG